MRVIFLDFETYYDQEYSLRNMTPVEYILDPRFEMQGVAVQEGLDGQPYWVDGPDVEAFIKSLPREVMIVTFNSLFDMCICAWLYGYVPKLMLDMIGVSRARLAAVLRSLSLGSVAKYLKVGLKGELNTKGLRFAQIKQNPGVYDPFVAYAKNDVALTVAIYRELVVAGQFPVAEMVIMDSVLRCAIKPKFEIDQTALAEYLFTIQQEKEQMLARAMLAGINTKDDLMSNEKFAECLRQLGVDPPMKISPTTGKQTYAFAKTDPGLIELTEHENIAVQVIVEARLGHKTTIEETRTQRFINISNLLWHENEVTPGGNTRRMPMPLRYSGAHTHRLSGDWKLNVQNLSRGGKLRKALKAPHGHVVVAVDSSQIEARMVAFLSGCTRLLTAFEEKRDVYSEFATEVFGRHITKADVPERFVGKQSILGLGYGLGWEKFGRTIPVLSLNQIGYSIPMPDEEAVRIVQTYRSTYREIPQAWKTLGNLIGISLAQGNVVEWGPVRFEKERILLPSGLYLYYNGLYMADGQWLYTFGGKTKRLYGGALMENISQALARIVIMDAMVRVRRRLEKYGIDLALQVHDELVYVVLEKAAELVKQIVLEEMNRRPSWGQLLPLASEAGIGPSYGEAK